MEEFSTILKVADAIAEAVEDMCDEFAKLLDIDVKVSAEPRLSVCRLCLQLPPATCHPTPHLVTRHLRFWHPPPTPLQWLSWIVEVYKIVVYLSDELMGLFSDLFDWLGTGVTCSGAQGKTRN